MERQEAFRAATPAPTRKASDVFAEQLRERILSGDLPPGTLLSNERALAHDAQLSRTVIRESLRILEIEGLVATRPGRNGGTWVRRPDPAGIERSLELFIRGRHLRFREVLDAREHIEPACAQFAAERRTAEGIAELERATEAVRAARQDVPAFLTANAEWHVTIARLSANELLSSFMVAIGGAVRAATDIDDFNSLEIRDDALHAHDAILEAIRAGDGAAARARMAHHVRAYREQVLEFPVPEEVDLTSGHEEEM
jgi:GntR family transcriptional regulator, transcriptional repressor for pyruvate dehydrogenase complex